MPTLTLTQLAALLPNLGDVCDWPVSYADCAGKCQAFGKWGDEANAARAVFERQAIDWLANATHHVFGLCETEIRPCRQGCGDGGSTYWGRGPRFDPGFPRQGSGRGGVAFQPVLVSGKWFNITCGCLGSCSCEPSGPATLSLPGPVQEIVEVLIDGVTVPPTSYRVDRKRWLIRTDGKTWPACQDMNAAPDAVGAFTIRYKRGVPVPVGGILAAGRLACELAMAACEDGNCALPENWQSLTRQGISITANTSEEARGQTGIWSIDDWVRKVNTPRPRAFVRSVDIPNLR